MLTTHPFDDDKLREECGVFGIWGAETAAAVVALGLHALQHRGQEAAGITSFDGKGFHSHRAMGHVAGNFDKDGVIRALAGRAAIGHVRYSTTGETALRNVQPLFAELASGGFAVAHNGNISNAMRVRRELNRRGSIFQSTSDTEVIIHLVATSTYSTLLDRFIDALKQVEGAYSLICLTAEGLIACRDPLGIRPLVMGRLGDAYIFASETVALDVVGATYIRTVEPGELIVVSERGVETHQAVRAGAAAALHLRACLFLAARQHPRRRLGLYGAQGDRRRAGARESGRGRLCRAGPRQRRAGGDRLCPGKRHPVRARHHPLALCRPHLHPAGRPGPPPRRQAEAQRQQRADRGKRIVLIDDLIVRGTTSLKIVQMLREAGAREVHMRIASPPTRTAASTASTRPSGRTCSPRR